MSRLPQPGGDTDRWGSVLNDYLSQEHRQDGTHDIPRLLNMPSTAGYMLVTDATHSSGIGWQLASTKADDNAVVHTAGDETIAGDKMFSGELATILEDSTPGIPITTANGAWRIVGGDGTSHMAFFKDMDGDGDYDADIWFKNNGYLVASGAFHFRPGYDDGGIEKGRIVMLATLDETTGLGVNYIQSARNYSGGTQNDLAFTRYQSSFRWLIFDESQNGYAGFGLNGGTAPDDALARIHAKDGAATIALFEGTNPSGTARIALKDITTTSGSAVTVGAFGDFMILRAGSTNAARLSATGLYVGGNVTSTAHLDVAPSSAAMAALRVRSGPAPTAPNDGDCWYDGADIYFRYGASSKPLATKAYVDTGGWASVPASATSTGVVGQHAYDASFMYVCVATNTWRRVALASW